MRSLAWVKTGAMRRVGVLGIAALIVAAWGCSSGDGADGEVYVPGSDAAVEGADSPAEQGAGDTGAPDVAPDAKPDAAADAADSSQDVTTDKPTDASVDQSVDASDEGQEAGEGGAEAGADANDEGCENKQELCNGADDNCNGVKDEGDPEGGEACTVPGKLGECVAGTTHCTMGSVKCVQNSPAAAELCDGKDNDCDGQIDNAPTDVGAACTTTQPGICKDGTMQCISGALECVAAKQPKAETCNGLDDDCDGTVDDGFAGSGDPCEIAGKLGECQPGQTNCLGGTNGCTPNQPNPLPEMCDGKDNDCNGSIDDPASVNGIVCTSPYPGICALGKTQCAAGLSTCIPDIQPGSQVETCNGKDDDCNGTADDGANIKIECAVKYSSALNVIDWKCTGGVCQVGGCVGSYKDCDGNPANGCEINAASDPSQCGECGKTCSSANGQAVCAAGICQILCNPGFGDCDANLANGCESQLVSDANNCGVCGKKCDGSTGTPTCNNGACSIACNPGLGDCDGNATTGCEVNLLTDPNHCGTCMTMCSNAGGTPSCNNAVCAISCNAGWGNCDAAVQNGCETNLQSSAANCGACGAACSSANGTPSCLGGLCNTACFSGWGNCDGLSSNGCEAPLNTTVNCGSCGKTCTNSNGTSVCSAGSCVPTCAVNFADCDGNPNNGCETNVKTLTDCGACGVVCAPAHATGTCTTGTCEVQACNAGWDDCDAWNANGCESNLQTSASNCGACGNKCNATGGTAICNAGTCTIACNAGFANCDGLASTGCEVGLQSDTQNCGTCGKVCSFAHATAACAAGSCYVSACTSGWGDCDSDDANGCEVSLTTNSNCGACGAVCSLSNATASCSSGTCGVSSCNGGFGNCDGITGNGCEANLQSSTSNCGTCGTACSSVNGTASCSSGNCTISCTAGFGNCDNDVSNGCEAQLTTTSNCGSCGLACANANGTTNCAGGVCTPTCSSGFASCDGNPNNGCEANTQTSTSHCGLCGKACSNANGTTACVAGVCVPGCASGFGNCDGNAQNGCETNLATSASNCGVCGVQCSNANGTTSCVAGACKPVCASGFSDCDGNLNNGCETSTQTSTSNCGSCGNACGSMNGTATCSLGACGLTCNSGYGNCDANLTNGCETLLNTTTNCGSCSKACTNAHGPTSCTAGACTPSCNSGYASCDTDPSNGCETDLLSSTTNCSACGTVCANAHGTTSCVSGACSPICSTGWGNCDASPANGCETNLNTTVTNCGACGTICTNPNGTTSCSSGVCAPACAAGSANCDGNLTNGCETNTQTNTNHCGSCGHVCSCPSGTATCNSGTCGCALCAAGTGDCDGNTANGCETALTSLTNCGACAAACNLPNATESCSTGSCLPTGCNTGFGNCDGVAANGCEVATSSSTSHCGGCGVVCSTTNGTPTCTSGSCGINCNVAWGNCDSNVWNGCETTLTTTTNCGACALACANANGSTTCTSGVCSPTCNTGYASCNGNPNDGCETNTTNSTTHCGVCGKTCTNANGTTSCVASVCTPVCTSGFGNCDSNPQNGCETNLNTSTPNCGACAQACTNANGTTSCSGGSCAPVCSSGFASCDGNARNGCETNTQTSTSNCGTCGTACNSTNGTPSCSAGSCSITCSSGWANCDTVLTNGCEAPLNANPNCGACGVTCSNANGTTSCTGSVCVPVCGAGFGNCDANPNNGCEASLKTLPNCGTCGTVCDLAHATESCATGSCVLSACDAGYSNCDGNGLNGCEVNTATDMNNCGTCGKVCTNPYGTAACVAGVCQITCTAGYGNCDANPNNGCEAPLNTLTNCGACAAACDLPNASESCSTGSCVLGACNSGYGNCDGNQANGCEVNTNTSAANCGACAQACSTNHGTPTCSLGACSIACTAGWGNCDLDARTNGCEISVYTTTNCGTCGTVCTNAHGTTTCPAGACTPSCSSGYGNCDSNANNGCETNINTDVTHCGASCTPCTNSHGSTSCSSGTCAPVCSAGYGNCDGNAPNGCETNIYTSTSHCGQCGKTCATWCTSGVCQQDCNGKPCGSSDGIGGTCVAGGGCCGGMLPGYNLAKGQLIWACGGQAYIGHQGDGNVVVYQNGGGALWSTGTGGQNTASFIMQGDGNLVLYGPSSEVYWYSNTANHPGAWAAIQGDCNFVIYDGGTAIWNTGQTCL
jgi:hypothetical protein